MQNVMAELVRTASTVVVAATLIAVTLFVLAALVVSAGRGIGAKLKELNERFHQW